jgi:hypothetical protein
MKNSLSEFSSRHIFVDLICLFRFHGKQVIFIENHVTFVFAIWELETFSDKGSFAFNNPGFSLNMLAMYVVICMYVYRGDSY